MEHQAENNVKRLGKTHANQEVLEEEIRKMEARVVRSARALVNSGTLQDVELLRELERDLEWFLTWRLKLADTHSVLWCDGVLDLAICSRGGLSYEINAKAYIGPESDASTTLCAVGGTLTLDEIAHRLRGYTLNIEYEDESLNITEGI